MTEKPSSTFHVGQEVIITSIGQKPYPGVVEKVGRTLVTVKAYGQSRKFGATAHDRTIRDGYGHEAVWTKEEYADRARRQDILAELQKGNHHPSRLTTDQLQRMLDIVKEGPDTPDAAGREAHATGLVAGWLLTYSPGIADMAGDLVALLVEKGALR